MGVGGMHLAEAAGAGGLDGKDMVRLAEALCPGLIDAAILASRIGHGLSFCDGHAGGFFGIDVLTGTHC